MLRSIAPLLFVFSALTLSDQTDSAQTDAASPRERLLMDHGWRFSLGHAHGGERDFDAVPADAAFNYFSKAGRGEGAASEKFDDSNWRLLNLPHDWAVELPFDARGSHSHGYKALGKKFPENSVGWYRRRFDIPAEDAGKRISVTFDGVFRDSQVWVNGYYLGRHSSGYTGFTYDLSDYLNYGGENVLVARVDASLEEGWFYEGAGIYRHVWLTKTAPLHIAQHGTFVRSEQDNSDSRIRITTTVKNDASEPQHFSIRYEIIAPDQQTVVNKLDVTPDTPANLQPGDSADHESALKVKNPELWDLDNPNLYTLRSSVLQDGKLVDQTETSFGIRYIQWTGDNGFLLNGKRVDIKGTNNHQNFAGVGTALSDELQYERIRMLKAMGTNALRSSHYPPARETLEACDRLGFLVMDETRETGINEQQLGAVRDMMLRDRNHPSVVIWSLGNEEWAIEGNDKGARITATMQNYARQFDDTRPFTVAISGGWGVGSSTTVEVMGFNYFNHGDTDAFHAQFPDKPTIGTEEGASFSTRGIYFDDEENCHITAYETTKAKWFTFAYDSIPHYLNRKWAAGQFRWTGFDYRGEPSPFGWPAVSTQFGAMDTCGFPKDLYYYYKAWWGDEPVLHLFPHWDWKGREGQAIHVWVYANCAKVDLRLNGQSLGAKDLEKHGRLEWQVPYEAGSLVAIGYDKNGKETLRSAVETTSEPASVRISSNHATLPADGDSVALIRVETLDLDGRHIATADDLVRFDISGPGRIIGVGNGNPSSHEPDKFADGQPWQRRLFNGLALVIVQSERGQEGDIVLTARSGSLKGMAIRIEAVAAAKLAPVVPAKETVAIRNEKPVPVLVEVEMPDEKKPEVK